MRSDCAVLRKLQLVTAFDGRIRELVDISLTVHSQVRQLLFQIDVVEPSPSHGNEQRAGFVTCLSILAKPVFVPKSSNINDCYFAARNRFHQQRTFQARNLHP
jgi:hypothetical protein